MRTTLQRAFSVLFGIALLVLLVGTVYQWRETREIDTFILVRLGIILTGILILARAVTSQPAAQEFERCTRCGARVFETMRSEDRQRVLTCFACGTELRNLPKVGPAPPEALPPA